MIGMIISSTGTTVLTPSTEGVARRSYSNAPFSTANDAGALGVCGDVRVSRTNLGIHIALDAEFVAPAALEALSNWLTHATPQRTCVRFSRSNGADDAVLASPQNARDFIFETLSSIDDVRARQYISLPLRDADCTTAPKWLRDGVAYWRQRGQWFDFLRDSDLDPLKAIFNGRYFIFQVTSDRGHVLHHAGPGYLVHSPIVTFASRERGTPVLALHDTYFAAKTQESYGDASTTFTATADRTDAIAEWPGFGRRRHQYWRLMLPYREAGLDWLIVASRMDSTVDFRSPGVVRRGQPG